MDTPEALTSRHLITRLAGAGVTRRGPHCKGKAGRGAALAARYLRVSTMTFGAG